MFETKHLTRSLLCFVTVLAVAVWATPPARADVVLSYSYGGLSGSYDPTGPNTGIFEALHTTDLDGDGDYGDDDFTSGNVRRLVDPDAGTAFFFWDPDPSSVLHGFGAAEVLLYLELTDIDRVQNTANAAGHLTVTDIDGDYIYGDVTGTWTLDPGNIAHFDGTIRDFVFEPELGWFDGNFGGFSMDFTEFLPEMIGSVVDLTGLTGGFFEEPFESLESEVITQMVPAPAAALLGALGLVTIASVRRRLS